MTIFYIDSMLLIYKFVRWIQLAWIMNFVPYGPMRLFA